MKGIRVLLVQRTIGVVNDDRLNKIAHSLSGEEGVDFYSALWERKNIETRGSFSGAGCYRTFKLPFASKKFPRPGWVYTAYEVFAESIQGYLCVKKINPDVIVLVNHRSFLLITLCLFFNFRRKKIVWDLQELPAWFMKKGSFRAKYFGFLLRLCDTIITTSDARKSLLRDIFGEKILRHAVVIPNYPSSQWLNGFPQPIDEVSESILRNNFVCYVQSASNPGRFPYNSVKSILLETNCYVFVSGFFSTEVRAKLSSEFGNTFKTRVYFLGMIKPSQIIRVLNRSLFSLILYSEDTENNKYCDPNRLYQAINKGVPVIVGSNPGMSSIVEKWNCGVIVRGDGRSLNHLRLAIKELLDNYVVIKCNAERCVGSLVWEGIEPSLLAAVIGEKSFPSDPRADD